MIEEKKIWYKSNSPRWGEVTWEVSNLGNVYRNGELFKCKLNSNGYYKITHGVPLHKIVAELFLDKPDVNYKLTIDHIDGNKLNNRVDNLRYCSQKENIHNPITYDKFLDYLHSDKHREVCRRGKTNKNGYTISPKVLEGYQKMKQTKTGTHRVWNEDHTKFYYKKIYN